VLRPAEFAGCIQFYDKIVGTTDIYEVTDAIRRHHTLAKKRLWQRLPI